MKEPDTKSKWEVRRSVAIRLSRRPGMVSLVDELAELDRLEQSEQERQCLSCGRHFLSAGPGNRMCGRCR